MHGRFLASLRALFEEHRKDYVEMGADASWLQKTLAFENERH